MKIYKLKTYDFEIIVWLLSILVYTKSYELGSYIVRPLSILDLQNNKIINPTLDFWLSNSEVLVAMNDDIAVGITIELAVAIAIPTET